MPDYEKNRYEMDNHIRSVRVSGTIVAFNQLINWLKEQYDAEDKDMVNKQTLRCKICQVRHARERYFVNELIDIIGFTYDWDNIESV